MLKDMFKKTKYVTLNDTNKKVNTEESSPSVPEGEWIKCEHCGMILYRTDVEDANNCCLSCKAYFRIDAYSRINMIIDQDTFEEWDDEYTGVNPLDFPGYDSKIQKLQKNTGLNEAVVTGLGCIQGLKTVIAVMDSRFMMGSMGEAVGEKITRAIENATRLRLPIIIFCASGGARMQEGIVSLMQMAKTSSALARHGNEGLLYVSILTDPTTGGVTASFAMLGDIIIAEPGALICFAGPRVIEQTINQKLPEGFQKAEFLLEHGFVDKIIERKDMKEQLGKILYMHRSSDK